MLDAKPIMKAIVALIERYLRHETIPLSEFKKVQETMDNYWTEYEKKHPRAKPFDSHLSAWLIYEQPFLAGTAFSSGGTPSYFLDLIEEECEGGESVAQRHFKHCTELFGAWT